MHQRQTLSVHAAAAVLPAVICTSVFCKYAELTGQDGMHHEIRRQHSLHLCLGFRLALYVQVRKGFGMDHETITQLAEKEAAGSSGVNFLPYITGERTPNWPHSSGVLTGLRPGSLRPGLLYRAAMEGATFSLLAGVPIIAPPLALTPSSPTLLPPPMHAQGFGSCCRRHRPSVVNSVMMQVYNPCVIPSAGLAILLPQHAWDTPNGVPLAAILMKDLCSHSRASCKHAAVAYRVKTLARLTCKGQTNQSGGGWIQDTAVALQDLVTASRPFPTKPESAAVLCRPEEDGRVWCEGQ